MVSYFIFPYLAIFSLFLTPINSEPAFGTPIIPNQCGSLGDNNPIIAKDCQTFKLSSGYCCFLTITLTQYDAEGNEENVERTACIISPNNNPKKKAELIKKYDYLNGDVLIECQSGFISIFNSYYMLLALLSFVLLL